MEEIRKYLQNRGSDDLGPVREAAKAALVHTQTIGLTVDALLARCELAQGSETTHRHQIEETRQTLGALSRESWNAHESLRLILITLAQLDEAEARLTVVANADAVST